MSGPKICCVCSGCFRPLLLELQNSQPLLHPCSLVMCREAQREKMRSKQSVCDASEWTMMRRIQAKWQCTLQWCSNLLCCKVNTGSHAARVGSGLFSLSSSLTPPIFIPSPPTSSGRPTRKKRPRTVWDLWRHGKNKITPPPPPPKACKSV